MAELEQLTRKISDPDTDLETAIRCFEDGMEHYKKCLQAQLEFDDNEMNENDIDTIHALQDKYHFQLTPPSGAAVLYRQKAVNNFEEHIKQIWRIYFFRPYIEKGGASDAQHQENDK